VAAPTEAAPAAEATAITTTPPKPPVKKAAKPKKVKLDQTEETPMPAQKNTKIKAPVKVAKAPKAAPKRALPAKAPTNAAKRALPKKVAKTNAAKPSIKAAVENVVPKIKAIKSRYFSDEQIEALAIVQGLKEISLAQTSKKLELRDVSERTQVLFNAKLGIHCRKCYTQPIEVEKIIGFLKRVPQEFVPFKWTKAFAGTP
jgi:hypothetical protein